MRSGLSVAYTSSTVNPPPTMPALFQYSFFMFTAVFRMVNALLLPKNLLSIVATSRRDSEGRDLAVLGPGEPAEEGGRPVRSWSYEPVDIGEPGPASGSPVNLAFRSRMCASLSASECLTVSSSSESERASVSVKPRCASTDDERLCKDTLKSKGAGAGIGDIAWRESFRA